MELPNASADKSGTLRRDKRLYGFFTLLIRGIERTCVYGAFHYFGIGERTSVHYTIYEPCSRNDASKRFFSFRVPKR